MAVAAHSRTARLFFSYAPADKRLYEQLKIHLSVFTREGLIDTWRESPLRTENDFKRPIKSYIERANIIVLLLSASFFNSDHCSTFEMPYALEQQQRRGTIVLPVMLRPADWKNFPLAHYQSLPSNGKPITGWSNRDNAFVDVVQGLRKAIEDLPAHLRAPLPSTWDEGTFLWSVPYMKNLVFTDRVPLLNALQTYFLTNHHVHPCIQALYGLGGVGKTQVALEYAWRYQKNYRAVFWFNATSRDLLSTEATTLAEFLDLPEEDRAEDHRLFAAIKRWLQNHDQWLCIFDNIESFELIHSILPSQANGHVLLTTMIHIPNMFVHTIPIQEMATEEGALLLLRRANLVAEDAVWKEVSPEHQSQAIAITQEFGGLPLAIDQAGAYLRETGRNLARYLNLYRQRKVEMLRRRGAEEESASYALLHPDSVVVTLSVTFQKVIQKSPEALELLSLLAFLHPDAIPEELIEQGAEQVDPGLQTLISDPFLFDQAMATLSRFSLIHRQSDINVLSMHRIVQVVLIERLTPSQKDRWATQVVHLVHALFPEPSLDVWEICERYLPQAQRCAELIQEYHMLQPEVASLLHRAGKYCYQRARYSEAETYLTHALVISEQVLGKEHRDTARILNNFARLSRQQGNYFQAEALYLRSLSIREREFGPIHPRTAESLNNLALVYKSLGRYAQAEELLQRVLAIDEQIHGPEHLITAMTLNSLGVIHYHQGRYTLAESLYQRTLEIYERKMPPTHLHLVDPLRNLGSLAMDRGRPQQAEPLYQRALSLCKLNVGLDHTETALSLMHLAHCYRDQAAYDQAEPLFRQSLAIFERALVSDHPAIARCLDNLAMLYEQQGQHQEAKSLYSQALKIYESALGPEHPETANVLDHLGMFFQRLRDTRQAEPLLRRSLAIREKVLGSEHPSTAHSLNHVAILLLSQRAYDLAEPLVERAYTLYQQLFSLEHPESIVLLEHYASLLRQTNRKERASAMLQAAQTLQEKNTWDKQKKKM